MNRQEKIDKITSAVDRYREEHNVTPTPGAKDELSCFAIGEGHNLLHRQLIPTTNDTGSWETEIHDGTDEVLDLVLEQIEKDGI